jgi:hypothetical protein
VQRGLTLLIAGGAAIVGIQLGLAGPLTSPVQPAGTAAVAPAPAADQARAQVGNGQQGDLGRGPDDGGGGRR